MNTLHRFFYRFSWFRETKWAYQRVCRGYDDRVIWGIDSYLAHYIPIWLNELKKKEQFPTSMNTEPDMSETTDEQWNEYKKKWNSILDEISDGFVAAESIIEGDSPAWDYYYEEFQKRYGVFNIFKDRKEHDELLDELGTFKSQEEETKVLMERFSKSMDLLKTHFFSLWS